MEDQEVQNILYKVIDRLKSKVEEVDMKSQQYFQKLQKLQKKLNEHMKKTCKEQIEWFKFNGQINENDQGINFSVNRGVDAKEAESRLEDFKQCARKNDFGMEDFLQNIAKSHEKIDSENNTCVNLCFQNRKMDKLNELEECFSKCFGNSLRDIEKSFDTIDTKVNEISYKL
jgi:hypothetical protein